MAEFTIRHFFFFPFFLSFLLFLQLTITTTTWGLSIVEVYSVTADGRVENVYGTITANSEAIYNKSDVDDSNSPSYILLTGPKEPLIFDVSTGRYVSVEANLTINHSEVGTAVVKVDAEGETDLKYDTLITQDFGPSTSPVELAYVIIKEAVVATVKVTLINGGSDTPRVIYGQMVARDSKLGSDTHKVDLFLKDMNGRITVVSKTSIELSRSKVAVSLSSSLLVQVYLLDYALQFPENQIGNGSVEFPASATGTFSKSISGENGLEIQVEVTWTSYT